MRKRYRIKMDCVVIDSYIPFCFGLFMFDFLSHLSVITYKHTDVCIDSCLLEMSFIIIVILILSITVLNSLGCFYPWISMHFCINIVHYSNSSVNKLISLLSDIPFVWAISIASLKCSSIFFCCSSK